MTFREFYTAVVNGTISDDEINFAQEQLTKLDERNEKRKAMPSKTAIANEPLKVAIVEMLANGGKFANEVGKALEVSTQKASGLLVQLEKAGQIESVELKVPKKGKSKFYTLKVETNAEYLDREVRA